MSVEGIKRDLEAWSHRPIAEICLKIVDFVQHLQSHQAEMLTYGSFKRAIGARDVSDELVFAITILTSSRVAALDVRAFYIDENDNEHEVNSEDLPRALELGEVIDPHTGELLRDAHARIVPFFVPSSRFQVDKP